MSTKKISALEQALLESEEILKAVEKNAKDMLYAQMKPDLDKTIKESIEADDEEKADDSYDNKTDELSTGDSIENTEISTETPEDTTTELPTDSETGDLDSTDTLGDVDTTSPLGGETSDTETTDNDELDLTGSTDAEVISVFKKLGDDAEIEVVKNGDNINIKNANGEEFIVKLNEDEKPSEYKEPKTVNVAGSIAEEEKASKQNASVYKDPKTVHVAGSILEEEPVTEDKYSFMDEDEDDSDSEKETIYEITMDGAADTEPEVSEPIEEVARTHADGRKNERKPEGFFNYAASRVRPAEDLNESTVKNKVLIQEAKELKDKNSQLLNENATLISDLNEHKETLRQLLETQKTISVFNTNLSNINKIFFKNSTTLDEKRNIVERFESVTSKKESESLYKAITSEIKNKIGISESVENAINKNVSGNTGKALLESTQSSQQNASISRIQELMNYSNKN